MTRAAVSIPSNIAEGAERDSPREFIRYLHIAKGSAAELRTQLYIAHAVHVVSEQDHERIKGDLELISRKLHKLIQSLKNTNHPKT
jgi:four helix bundle protein